MLGRVVVERQQLVLVAGDLRDRLGELSAIVNEVAGNKTLKEDMDAYYNRGMFLFSSF